MANSPWPDAADAAGWTAAALGGDLAGCPPGRLVGALRAHFRDGDRRLVHVLATQVSRVVMRRLRKLIGVGHANRGEDIVVEAHGRIMASVFDPDSADGAEMVDHFWARVRNRGVDVAREEGRRARRHISLAKDDDGEVVLPRGRRMDGGAGSIDASHLLSRIADPKKRLAFRLAMEGMRVRQGDPCVATVLGCNPKTAARWVVQARETLAAEMGVRA